MYIYEGKYSKKFNSDSITNLKYNLLYEFAILLRDYKNKISQEINDNILMFLNMSKYSVLTYFRSKYPKEISSYFDALIYNQILISYKNKFNA